MHYSNSLTVSSCNLRYHSIGTYGAEQPPVSEATVDLVLLKQFEYQATSRLLLTVLEEYGDSDTTQNSGPAAMVRPVRPWPYQFLREKKWRRFDSN